MSEPRQPTQSDAKRLEEAAAWRVRLHAEQSVEADFQAFESWVADPVNRVAYDRVEMADAFIDTHAEVFVEALSPAKPGRYTRYAVTAGIVGFAASIALAVVLMRPAPGLVWTRYQAPATAPRDVTLADGSVVHLNRRAEIEVALGANERRVYMEGEAAFDVSHNPSRPFVVDVGDQQVRVLGTEFDVLHASGQTTVTVRRGIVEVSLPHHGDQTLIQLRAGNQSKHRDGSEVVSTAQVDPEAAFAWREGKLIYADAPLTAVVADLNRYYDKPIRLGDAGVGALRFSGVLVVDSEEQVVARLQAFLPIRVQQTGGGYTLLQRPQRHPSP